MFCVIVDQIGYVWLSLDEELSAAVAVTDSVETHVDGFGALMFDGVVCKFNSG